MKNMLILVASVMLAGCAAPHLSSRGEGPAVAAHQHLISPAFAPIARQEPIDGAALLQMMDAAGTARGVILSMGYSFSDERKKLDDPEGRTHQENDWTASQVALAPKRLRGFCSVNPLAAGAIAEIERCNGLPGMRGLKLHFGNSGVSLRNPEHAARMRTVFALADRLRVPVVVHLRSRGGMDYGPQDARLFIDQLLPMAPHVTVQIAHLAGSGPGLDPVADTVLEVFADAIRRRDPRVRHLIFDLTTVVSPEGTAADAVLLARRIREIGIERVVFGSDLPIGSNPPLAQAWSLFREKAALTPQEFDRIARNVPPYLRGSS